MKPDLLAISLPALSVATLLLGSGLAKLIAPNRLQSALQSTYRLRRSLARPIGLAVPVVEVTSSFLVFYEPTRLVGLLLASSFLLATMLFVSVHWAAGSTGDCGCWGAVAKSSLSARTILSLTALTVLTIGLTVIYVTS